MFFLLLDTFRFLNTSLYIKYSKIKVIIINNTHNRLEYIEKMGTPKIELKSNLCKLLNTYIASSILFALKNIQDKIIINKVSIQLMNLTIKSGILMKL